MGRSLREQVADIIRDHARMPVVTPSAGPPAPGLDEIGVGTDLPVALRYDGWCCDCGEPAGWCRC